MGIIKKLEEHIEGTFMIADGFDDCIIGIHSDKVVYSKRKILDKLIKRDGMSFDDANEFFEFNIEGFKGEYMPIYVDDLFFDL